MESVPGLSTRIQQEIALGKSYTQVAEELQAEYAGKRGFSARSVRRFCANHGISPTSLLSDHQLDKVVATGVSKVCESPKHSFKQRFDCACSHVQTVAKLK